MEKILIISIIISILLSGCDSRQPDPVKAYLTQYQPATEPILDMKTRNFVNLYKNLKHLSAAESVEKTYAEVFYFNDTLVTLHSRKGLVTYLENTQQQLQSIDLKVLNILKKGEDVFLQWEMWTTFKVFGVTRHVHSIGISHLRFNIQEKIILHQDYWDNTSGFFQHIPILGEVLKWTKESLH